MNDCKSASEFCEFYLCMIVLTVVPVLLSKMCPQINTDNLHCLKTRVNSSPVQMVVSCCWNAQNRGTWMAASSVPPASCMPHSFINICTRCKSACVQPCTPCRCLGRVLHLWSRTSRVGSCTFPQGWLLHVSVPLCKYLNKASPLGRTWVLPSCSWILCRAMLFFPLVSCLEIDEWLVGVFLCCNYGAQQPVLSITICKVCYV